MSADFGEPIRIAIADDSQVVRDLVDEVVEYFDEYELAATFDNGRDIIEWVRGGGTADVFVIDMRLPGLSGTATINTLRRFGVTSRILAFSASGQEQSVRSAIAAGADSYLLKEATLDELLEAISVNRLAASSDHGAIAAPEPDPPGSDRQLKVLVVEDHDLVRETISETLQSEGFTVSACESAGAVRQWLASGENCDVALVDLRLAGESGETVVGEIHEHLPNTAVILHSGATDEDGARLADSSGADGFLAKGDYTIGEMVDVLRQAVEARCADDGRAIRPST